MKTLVQVLLVVVLGLVLVTQSGCLIAAAAGAAGAGVAYVKGDLESTFDAPPDKVIEAAKAAMQDLQFVTVSSGASTVDGELIARTATDKKVVVKAKSLGPNASKVSIRVGTWGDESISRQVYDKIKSHLPATAQPAK